MYPGVHAQTRPDHPAIVMADGGEVITHGELDRRSNLLAQAWWAHGLRPDDGVALLASNQPWYLVVAWAAMRSGLRITPVSRHLSASEIAYIVNDCGARSLVVDADLDVAAEVPSLVSGIDLAVAIGGSVPGFVDEDDLVEGVPEGPLADQPRGVIMLYSSGTTGRPKGIKRARSGQLVSDPDGAALGFQALYGLGDDTVYLCPAPLYHAAPLSFSLAVQALGGTVVLMRRFDPVVALRAIEEHRVTHAQFVPTMFVRMLKLDRDAREAYDTSSLRTAIHSAAPCPVEVKREMIEWWGPVLVEFYGGSEGVGLTVIDSEQWLAHPGSVGPAVWGIVHICDDDGNELPTGETGLVYFESDLGEFEYHGDADKTRKAQHPTLPAWRTLGDIGRLDDEGFLYLSDRKAFMIISGGVNIYPQEVEDCLIMHDAVADVAVFGLPDPDMGEYVQAVVQPADGVDAGESLAQELRSYARDRIAHYKVPRDIAFRAEFPRGETGKLYKRLLRDEFTGTDAGS